ncbi:hypothetical protein MTR67_031877, partial [Solanum verrucosum]
LMDGEVNNNIPYFLCPSLEGSLSMFKPFFNLSTNFILLDIMVSGQSGDSRERGSGYLNFLENRDGGNAHTLTRQENCGKGTIRSVHSRFRPIGDGGVALSNHVGRTFNLDSRVVNKETSSDRYS